MQPNTQFKIDEYHYAGVEDGTERSIFRLVKGGIRFISGVIGHTNKQNYQIRTTVATIGIRGSAGRAEMCAGGSCAGLQDGLYLTCNQDTLTMTNDTGTTELGVGQTFHTSCVTCSPQKSQQSPGAYVSVNEGGGEGDEGSNEKQNSSPSYQAGNERDENGEPLVIAGAMPDESPMMDPDGVVRGGVRFNPTSFRHRSRRLARPLTMPRD